MHRCRVRTYYEIVWKCKTHYGKKVKPTRVSHVEFVNKFTSLICFYKKFYLFRFVVHYTSQYIIKLNTNFPQPPCCCNNLQSNYHTKELHNIEDSKICFTENLWNLEWCRFNFTSFQGHRVVLFVAGSKKLQSCVLSGGMLFIRFSQSPSICSEAARKWGTSDGCVHRK
jgi:hypothetical protein